MGTTFNDGIEEDRGTYDELVCTEVHTRELMFVDVFFVLLVHGSSKVTKKLVKTTI